MMSGMGEDHVVIVSLEVITGVSYLSQRKKRFVGMIREDFYVLGGGSYVGNRHGAMMRLRNNLVIGQFHVDGGRGSSFLEVVNGSGQRPGVGRASTIDGPVIMFRVQRRRDKIIRITSIHSRFRSLHNIA